MNLLALQRQLQASVLEGRSNVAGWVVGDAKADAEQRLRIYVDAYRLRLLEVLGKDFPGVRGLLGVHEFEAVARGYIDACPSDLPSIRWFGRHFAAFLRAQRGNRTALAETAQFEWLQGEVFDAADAPVMPADAVAAVPAPAWSSMRLVLHPAVRRVDFLWNVVELWRAIRDGQPTPAPTLLQAPVPYVLWRRELTTHWRPLDGEETVALDAGLSGATFGEICERLTSDDAPLTAASLLKRWVADGLLSGLELGANSSLTRSAKGVGYKLEDLS